MDGEDPLEPFGPNAARHVSRTDGFTHCPDIVVNSTYWADTDEVAAFEELVGSHGGMEGASHTPSRSCRRSGRHPRSRWSAPRPCTPTSAAGWSTRPLRLQRHGRTRRAGVVIRGRLHRSGEGGGEEEPEFVEIDTAELTGVFAAPTWLRDIGVSAWLFVGVALFLVGAVWSCSHRVDRPAGHRGHCDRLGYLSAGGLAPASSRSAAGRRDPARGRDHSARSGGRGRRPRRHHDRAGRDQGSPGGR